MVQKLTGGDLLQRPPRTKIVVGLTGSIGTGKSTVAKMFKDLGAAVFDADKIAHEALLKGSPVYEKISRLFPHAKTGSGKLDRRKIAAVVFKDASLRKKLERLIHPYVLERLRQETERSGKKILILEVPLLFETGWHRACDETVVVSADPQVVERRLVREAYTPEEIALRRNNQMPLAEKIKRSETVINNSGNLEETKRAVKQVWQRLQLVSKGEK